MHDDFYAMVLASLLTLSAMICTPSTTSAVIGNQVIASLVR